VSGQQVLASDRPSCRVGANQSLMESLRRWIRRSVGLVASRISNPTGEGETQTQAQATSAPRPSGTPWTPEPTSPDRVIGVPPVYKVVTVGGGGVGKSSLIVRFMYDEVRLLKPQT